MFCGISEDRIAFQFDIRTERPPRGRIPYGVIPIHEAVVGIGEVISATMPENYRTFVPQGSLRFFLSRLLESEEPDRNPFDRGKILHKPDPVDRQRIPVKKLWSVVLVKKFYTAPSFHDPQARESNAPKEKEIDNLLIYILYRSKLTLRA